MTLIVGRKTYRVRKVTKGAFRSKLNATMPVLVGQVGERRYWLFQGRYYWDNDGLDGDQVHALLVTRQQRDDQRIARAQAMVAMGTAPRPSARGAIPDDVRQLVWQRDGGRCRNCDATVELQFDHIIPVSMGGASTVDNLQVLCGPCNRRKGAGLTNGSRGTVTRDAPSQPQPSGQWGPDPYRRHELRYWDGNEWTAHVSDRGVVSNDAVIE